MNIQLRSASLAELSVLLPLMRRYYEDDHLSFASANADAMARLLDDPRSGRVWFIECEARTAGYVALCFGFSLELGGREAYIDELFVERDLRGRGIARRAMERVLDEARALDVRAVHLEVDATNERALRLYASLGFSARDRYYLMTKTLGWT